MNERDLDRLLTAWADDPSTPPPPRYLGEVLDRTRRTRQRPAWTSLERWNPVTITLRTPTLPLPARLLALGLSLVLALLAVMAVGTIVGSLTRVPATVMAPSPGNGLIAFTSEGDIHVVDPARGEPRLLVGGPGTDVLPSWSPDGSRLLFWRISDTVASASYDFAPFVTDAEGTEPVPITQSPLRDVSGLSWAPDGSQVVVASTVAGTVAGDGPMLSILLLDGSADAGHMADNPGSGVDLPAWRPVPADRSSITTEILYRRTSDPGELWLSSWGGADGGGGRSALLMDTERMEGSRTSGYLGTYDFLAPAWSPDGSHFAYHTLNDIGTNAPDGNGFRIHVGTMADCDGERCATDALLEFDPASDDESDVRWSPDGTRLAFQAYDAGGTRLVIMTISLDPEATVTDVVATEPIGGECCHPLGYAWAPDGSALVLSNMWNPTSTAWLVDAETAELEPLDWHTDDWPSWQRSG